MYIVLEIVLVPFANMAFEARRNGAVATKGLAVSTELV